MNNTNNNIFNNTDDLSDHDTTPDCNTGVENAELNEDTETAPKAGFKPISQALVDYLRFTVHPSEDGSETEDEIAQRYMNLLGVGGAQWDIKPYGLYRYRKSARCEGFYIAWDGAELGMGVCIQISGEGCRQLEQLGIVDVRTVEYEHKGVVRQYSFDGWPRFLETVRREARVHFSRIDVAFDDADERIDIETMCLAVKDRRLVTKFRWVKPYTRLDVQTGEEDLTSIYFGHRTSAIMIRAYDKARQQKMDCHWVRVEIEAKDERAEALVEQIVVNGAMAAAGVVSNYIDFKERGEGSQRCRWKTCAWWSEFLQWAAKVRLCGLTAVHTIEKVKKWIEGQVAPMLAVYFRAAGSSMEKLLKVIHDGEKRFRRRHFQLLSQVKESPGIPASAAEDGPEAA